MRILSEVETVFVPAGRLQSSSLARDILEAAGCDAEGWRELEFPMSNDPDLLTARWQHAAREVAGVLEAEKDAAFVTLGDPSVYSTWVYLSREIKNGWPKVPVTVVPGIQTMNAAAAAFRVPLVAGKERLALLPLPEDESEIEKILALFHTAVFYKIGSRLEKLTGLLRRMGLSDDAYFAQRVGFPEELLAAGLAAIPGDADGYLSVMIVHNKKLNC
jgi:precorrin-2/cobalt-factor-2 C20-methyltransferase